MGFNHSSPHLIVREAAEALAFYDRAFGLVERSRTEIATPGGAMILGHADLRISGRPCYMAEECPEYESLAPPRGEPTTVRIEVDALDTAFARAVEAGAVVVAPIVESTWGNRHGELADPFGHRWIVIQAQGKRLYLGERSDERYAEWYLLMSGCDIMKARRDEPPPAEDERP